MIKNILTIGLFDKNTEQQEIETNQAKNIIANILINDFDIFAFTMMDCNGVYKMASTNNIVCEPSIRVEIATDNEITPEIDGIIEALKTALNQESIMHERATAEIYFK